MNNNDEKSFGDEPTPEQWEELDNALNAELAELLANNISVNTDSDLLNEIVENLRIVEYVGYKETPPTVPGQSSKLDDILTELNKSLSEGLEKLGYLPLYRIESLSTTSIRYFSAGAGCKVNVTYTGECPRNTPQSGADRTLVKKTNCC